MLTSDSVTSSASAERGSINPIAASADSVVNNHGAIRPYEDDLAKYLRPEAVARQFTTLSALAAMGLMLPRSADALDVTESEVSIKTPDGNRRLLFRSSAGASAAVLVWPDIFGLRPAFRQMGKRLAESGYAVLVVNPFYRVKPAPTAAQARPRRSATAAADAGSDRDDAHERMRRRSSRGSISSRPCRRRRKSARRATAWAARSPSARPQPFPSRRRRRLVSRGGLVTDMPNSPHSKRPRPRRSSSSPSPRRRHAIAE